MKKQTLSDRVAKLEQIVEGLSKSAIVAAAAKKQDVPVVDEWAVGNRQEFENRLTTGKTAITSGPVPSWFHFRAPLDINHEKAYHLLFNALGTQQKVYEHITSKRFLWDNIRAELAVSEELKKRGYAINKPEDRAGAEALPEAMKERNVADEVYDRLEHWEAWQKAADVVLRSSIPMGDGRHVTPATSTLGQSMWRNKFELLKSCPPEIQLECVEKWVRTDPAVGHTIAFADWALANRSWLLLDGKSKPRKR